MKVSDIKCYLSLKKIAWIMTVLTILKVGATAHEIKKEKSVFKIKKKKHTEVRTRWLQIVLGRWAARNICGLRARRCVRRCSGGLISTAGDAQWTNRALTGLPLQSPANILLPTGSHDNAKQTHKGPLSQGATQRIANWWFCLSNNSHTHTHSYTYVNNKQR